MAKPEAIEAFQQALFEYLSSSESVTAWWPEFIADPRTRCYAEQLNRWEPRFVALAQELRKKWSREPSHHD